MLLETHIQNFCQIHSEIPKLHNKKWQSYSFEARGGRGGGEGGEGGGEVGEGGGGGGGGKGGGKRGGGGKKLKKIRKRGFLT